MDPDRPRALGGAQRDSRADGDHTQRQPHALAADATINMTDPRAIPCNARRLSMSSSRHTHAADFPISHIDPVVASSSRPAQVHHHHQYRSAIAADAHIDPANGVEHPIESDKHTLFFILNSNGSTLDYESASAHHGDIGYHNPLCMAHDELSFRFLAPPVTRRAWTSSDSSCGSGDSSPSMRVSSMMHDLHMSSLTTPRPAPTHYARAQTETARSSPPAVPSITQGACKSSRGTVRRASAASRSASRAEQLEKKRGRMCKMDGCENYIVHKGLCCRHGGGKKCTIAGCNTSAKHLGLCWKHGGSTECDIDGCTKRAKARRLCWAHGGGTKCASAECEKVAVSGGFCWAHGGGKRCNFDNCNKPAYERTQNFCAKHHAEMQHVTYFEV